MNQTLLTYCLNCLLITGFSSCSPFLSVCSRHQQYECKWYIPLADLTFQTLDDSDSVPSVQVLPEHEIEEMKIKISVLKSEIQKEKVTLLVFTGIFSQIQCTSMARISVGQTMTHGLKPQLICKYSFKPM